METPSRQPNISVEVRVRLWLRLRSIIHAQGGMAAGDTTTSPGISEYGNCERLKMKWNNYASYK